MRVIIFFTYGNSLKSWKESGLLNREIKLYKFLAKNYDIHFTFVTYGDKEDNAIIENLLIENLLILNFILIENLLKFIQ